MADATDLKSVIRKGVRVRVPPSLPFTFFYLYTDERAGRGFKSLQGTWTDLSKLNNIEFN